MSLLPTARLALALYGVCAHPNSTQPHRGCDIHGPQIFGLTQGCMFYGYNNMYERMEISRYRRVKLFETNHATPTMALLRIKAVLSQRPPQAQVSMGH